MQTLHPYKLILVSLEGRTACFSQQAGIWQLLEINYSEWTISPVVELLEDLQAHLQATEAPALQQHQLTYVFDDIALEQLPKLITALLAKECEQFQCLRWQNVHYLWQAQQAKAFDLGDRETIQEWLCPFIEHHFLEPKATPTNFSHETILHPVSAEQAPISVAKLAQVAVTSLIPIANALLPNNDAAQISKLEAQCLALSSLNNEQLITFMPLFFETFFLQVKPSDLALMSGSLQLPDLASTFTEPDMSTQHMLKRKFQRLPDVTQQQIILFAQELQQTHSLTLRKIMQSWLLEEHDHV